MIVADRKPIDEIVSTISEFRNVLVLGCGGCVSVCLTGGDREAVALSRDLDHPRYYDNDPPGFKVDTIERQCEPDFVESFLKIPDGTEAVLTLACGAGVQTMAAVFKSLPIIPAVNTTFMGATKEPGVWQEMCRGCGDCMLAFTGGICPIARCAKNLFHGPCGGTSNGSCEVDVSTPCAWSMIFFKLKKIDRLDLLRRVRKPRDWRMAGGSGPRELVRPFNKPFG
jgi:ferredoxin